MKCPKCKSTMNKDNKFCDQCGYSFKKRKRNLLIIVTCILAVVGFLIGCLSSYYLSPKYVALKYFKTVISNDTSSIYKYVDSDSPFVSEELFSKKYEEIGNVTNYKVEDIVKENDYVKVNFSFLLDGNESNAYVKLKEKKFLNIFTYYKVESGTIARNVHLRVLKNSEVKVDGVDVSKYLKTSEEYYDVYVLPDLVSSSYSVDVNMPTGISVTKDISFEDNGTYTISKIKLEQDLKEEFKSDILDKINILYKASVDSKKYDEISNSFYNDLSNLYRSIKRSIGSNISSFNFSFVSINSAMLNEEGMLCLEIFADYDLKVNDEEKSDYLSLRVIYSYDDGKFNLYDIDSSYQVKPENYN